MKKQFVTYPIALALNQLGFDEKCFGYFTFPDTLEYEICSSNEPNMKRRGIVAVPTWQQVIDYLRTQHSIHIAVYRQVDSGNRKIFVGMFELWNEEDEIEFDYSDNFSTYEEAREAAILKAIEIIKNK